MEKVYPKNCGGSQPIGSMPYMENPYGYGGMQDMNNPYGFGGM